MVAAKPEGIQLTANMLASVAKLARVVVTVPDEEWDADPDILVCDNGALHVPTGELRPHDLYNRYRTWCFVSGHKAKSVTQIAEDWRRLGFRYGRDKNVAVWHGVAPKSVVIEER